MPTHFYLDGMIFCGPLSTTRYLCIEKAMHYFPYPDVTLRHQKNWPGDALPWQNFEKMKYFLQSISTVRIKHHTDLTYFRVKYATENLNYGIIDAPEI